MLLCIIHTNLLIYGKKKTFSCTKLSVRNCGANIGYVIGHGKVVVEFVRKVFLVDCILWKTLSMANISITERALKAFLYTRKLQVKPFKET